MKKVRLVLATAAILAVVYAIGGALGVRTVQAQNGYTVESLAGAYAFSEEGSVGTVAIAGIGLISFDGKGNLSGRETVHMPGVSLATTLDGTYEIDASGLGTMTVNHRLPLPETADLEAPPDTNAGTAKYSFVVTNKGGALKAIRLDQGALVTTSLERQ